MDFQANQRFNLRNARGEELIVTVISTYEIGTEQYVNVRPGDGELMSIRATELTQELMRSGVALPMDDANTITPEQAILELERRRGTFEPPAMPEPTIDQLPDLPDDVKTRLATAAQQAPPAPNLTSPRAARADALDAAPAWASNATAPEAPLGTIGEWAFHAGLGDAIAEWRRAQNMAISLRVKADVDRAVHMLAASEGQVKGLKLSNEQSRRAYAEEKSSVAEAAALRAECDARALQFWVERLAGTRR